MNKKIIGFGVVFFLIVAGGSFYGGLVYGKRTARNTVGNFFRNGQGVGGGGSFRMTQGGQNGAGRGQGGNGIVSGEIISINENTLTVKLQDGGSRLLIYSPSTSVRTMTEVSTEELKIGKFISANGTQGTGGAIVAQFIQLREASSTPFGFGNR